VEVQLQLSGGELTWRGLMVLRLLDFLFTVFTGAYGIRPFYEILPVPSQYGRTPYAPTIYSALEELPMPFGKPVAQPGPKEFQPRTKRIRLFKLLEQFVILHLPRGESYTILHAITV
jgi:hypothetical protein